MHYIILYSFLAFLAFNYEKFEKIKKLELLVFLILLLFLTIRWETGGDFGPYEKYFDDITNRPVFDSPLFYVLNLIPYYLNLELVITALFSSILFLLPLFYSIKKIKHNIYLYLCIAFPVLILIYGMGSIRQGLAMVFFMMSISYQGNKLIKYTSLLIPIFFHDTSIFLVFIYLFSKFLYKKKFSKQDFQRFTLLIIIFISGILIFYDQFSLYFRYYIIEDQYHSSGSFIRSAIICLPSFIYLLFHNKISINNDHSGFLFFSSLLVIVLTLFSFVFSQPVDRLMGYMLIFNLLVYYYIFEYIITEKYKRFSIICVLFLHFIILLVWLFGADNAWRWLPYQTYFL